MNKSVGFCGTRGIPANYGGFETAVDEITKILSEQNVDCHVFGRSKPNESITVDKRKTIYVQGSSSRKLDTFVSSINTGLYLLKHRKEYEFVFWFNNANLPGIILTKLAGIPMAVNTDGLEWKRAKWSWPFKLYYFLSSMLICFMCKTLISDAQAIQNYYKRVFKKRTQMIPYGAPEIQKINETSINETLEGFGVEKDKYFLQITRFEPDNLPLEIIDSFYKSKMSDEGYKYVVIGYKESSPYADAVKAYSKYRGIIVLPALYDKEKLQILRENAICYVHGNSVGGTNPALLEAMASCKRVLAIDVEFSKEVIGDYGLLFKKGNITKRFREVLKMEDQSSAMKIRLSNKYQWDAVAKAYFSLVTSSTTNYFKELHKEEVLDLSVL